MEDNKYRKDYAEPESNFDELDELFGIDNNQPDTTVEVEGDVVDIETGEVLDEVKRMRKELKDLQDEEPDIDQIILSNVNRANRILDKVEDSIERGEFTASMIEAAGKLIDSVTSAATSITGISYNSEVLKQKDRDLDRKEKELAIKQITQSKNSETNITNNNLIMNREDLMELIESGGKKEG